MAWTAPMTAVSGDAFSADDFNTYVRDNLNETMPALATDDSYSAWFVATGENELAKRNVKVAEVATEQNTTSQSFTDLTTSGPTVSLTTGTRALVMITCQLKHQNTNGAAMVSFAVSGATTKAASDDWGIYIDGLTGDNSNRKGTSWMFTDLTPGTNTFTMKYRVGSATGWFAQRQIIVWAM